MQPEPKHQGLYGHFHRRDSYGLVLVGDTVEGVFLHVCRHQNADGYLQQVEMVNLKRICQIVNLAFDQDRAFTTNALLFVCPHFINETLPCDSRERFVLLNHNTEITRGNWHLNHRTSFQQCAGVR